MTESREAAVTSRPTLPTFAVGDTVQIQSRGPNGHWGPDLKESNVEKVGRIWLTVLEYGRPRQFDAKTGLCKSDGYGYGVRIVTPEMLAFEETYQLAQQRLRNATGRPGSQWHPPRDLSLDQLNRIADILEEPRNER